MLVYKKASEACVGGVGGLWCCVEGENEDSCSFFASLIEFN